MGRKEAALDLICNILQLNMAYFFFEIYFDTLLRYLWEISKYYICHWLLSQNHDGIKTLIFLNVFI